MRLVNSTFSLVTKDTPSADFSRLLAQLDPFRDVLRRSRTHEVMVALERQDQFKKLLRQPALEALTKSPKWPDISATLQAARRAHQISSVLANTVRANDSLLQAARSFKALDVFPKIRLLDQELSRRILTANRAVLPGSDTIRPFTERAITALQPTAVLTDALAARQTTLAKMAKLTTPWLLKDHPAVSAAGFVRITRLREVATERAPYERAASHAYEEELGEPVPFNPDAAPEERETAAVNAGTNPEVIAFPKPAYPQVLIVAGFNFDLPASPAPPSDTGDSSAAFDPQHAALLRYVEDRLRALVIAELSRIAGSAWIRRRVPKDMKDKWENRRDTDRDQRGDSYPPIYYADLTDLSDLICRKDNWNDAFKPIFKYKDEFQVGMRRLNPIRNAIAHSRPLVRTDQLFLASEALRLFRALGIIP